MTCHFICTSQALCRTRWSSTMKDKLPHNFPALNCGTRMYVQYALSIILSAIVMPLLSTVETRMDRLVRCLSDSLLALDQSCVRLGFAWRTSSIHHSSIINLCNSIETRRVEGVLCCLGLDVEFNDCSHRSLAIVKSLHFRHV